MDILRKLRREYLKKIAAGDAEELAAIALTPLRTCLAERIVCISRRGHDVQIKLSKARALTQGHMEITAG